MEQLVYPKSSFVPVPTPCESFSLLSLDDSILTVTPEKTLSSKIIPITESLKECSFLDEDGKDNKSKVQFNRSVAVFHFSPDQTFTADENSRESFDSLTFESSLGGDFSENSHRFVSHNDRIEKIMKKVSKIDAKLKRNYSDSCRLDLQNNDYDLKDWQLDDPTENDLGDNWSTPIGRTCNESESGLADSPIVTDVYSREDEVSWKSDGDENDVGHECDEDVDSSSRNNFSNKSSCQKVQMKADSYPTRSEVAKSTSVDLEKEKAQISHPTAETSSKTPETDARLGRISVSSEIERMASCPLLRPSANTTLKYSADVDKLKRQSFEKEVLSRGKIKDAKLQAKIEGKALSRLNVSESNQFKDLVSIDVDKEEICQKVAKEKMSKVRREKVARAEDKVSRMPDVMDFYNEDYFVYEPTCTSSKDTCNAFRPFKSKLKTADIGRALDLYRHVKMWDGLPY